MKYNHLKTNIERISNHVYMIKLNPPILGFKDFLVVWLYKNASLNILIDPGPAITANQLLEALYYLNITNLNYIFITHIHMDHAGGIEKIIKIYKGTKIICHEKGTFYLKNPNLLWKSSLKSLGYIAQSYTPPPKLKIINNIILGHKTNLKTKKIQILETPGHSSHHISLSIKQYLFTGESAGTIIKIPSKFLYMRPATPKLFFKNLYLKSIAKLNEVRSEIICYGHLGKTRTEYKTINTHKEQIELWKTIISKIKTQLDFSLNNNFIKKCIKKIFKRDQIFRNFIKLRKKIQKRELFFINNSIKGISRKKTSHRFF